ncbi:centrosomal protein of 68 kDa [Pelodytes ibericus]
MDLTPENTPRASSYSMLHATSQPSVTMRSTLSETTDSSDDLEEYRTRSRTFLDSSWVPHGISASQIHHNVYSGARKSIYPSFSKSKESDQSFKKKSSFQEQYWACAIPDTTLPCPDRSSPRWDPNKEYQDLLDYTYPLNPKCFISKDSEETESEPFFRDSGIDLDSYNESRFPSFGFPFQEHELRREKYSKPSHQSSPHAFSTPLVKKSFHHCLRDPTEYSNDVSFEVDSPYARKNGLGEPSYTSYSSRCNTFDQSKLTASIGTKENLHFIPTTKILPLHKDIDSDEEYLSLPSNLKELESLATHLKDLSLNASKNRYANCAHDNDSQQDWILHENAEDFLENRKSRGSDQGNYRSRKNSETTLSKFSSVREMLDRPFSFYDLDASGSSPREKVHETKTLVQIIQTFCHNLDKLIQWLYDVAKITDNWIAPKPNVESIQSSLSLYLKFKKDIEEQKGLTDTVLKDGELLLKYISVNSSVLKDTLALISKQSGDLGRHAERLYASVLEAMDTVTDDSMGRNGNVKQHISLEMETH